jgi:hypothetical protein
MDEGLVRSIAELVKSVPEILEAHLPQCAIPGIMQGVAQMLVVVVPATGDIESALRPLHEGLGRLIPPGHHLDVWPILPDNNLLPAVRSTGCNVENSLPGEAPKTPGLRSKKWWKLW